jgi:hypothetical protein
MTYPPYVHRAGEESVPDRVATVRSDNWVLFFGGIAVIDRHVLGRDEIDRTQGSALLAITVAFGGN